ncbi:von Willebrand factor A domain-containing protein 5A-like [Hippocampus comes]|uniref:von Willebrand factor A domain-containing protein 5A-like n=1 Tax=Hippocampus comes TaxID=109280 RepID=UPI00094E16A0|nr:PREDICTED: von Willebrand factor A domain-containing protein 5A-like [Hippocampus comes]
MQSLRFALQAAAEDITLTWDLPKEVSVTPLSPLLATIFQGQRSLIYAQLTGRSSQAEDACVTVKYNLAGQPSQSRLRFALRPKEDTGLKSIEVEVDVRDHVATVLASLHYENKEDSAIEAVFVFPLPAEAAVCHFAAKIGQSEIVAEVKERREAREEYDDALSSGRQAFLLEESEQSPDIFSLSVGSLPPGESASIRLEYVTELAVEADDGLRFCLPVVLNPRYHPQGSQGVKVTSVVASGAPYALSFSARVSSPRQVTKVDSECCLEPLRYLDKEQTSALVRLAAGHQFDRDVELLIYYKDAHRPAAVVEAGKASAEPGTLMGDAVVMVSLYPEFPPAAATSSLATRGEFVFLLDRSGSMDCPMDECHRSVSRISSARDTLLLLLKSLPMGCYFNIYSFGSSFQHVFPQSVEYGEATLVDALKKVEQMGADLGGTEILQPLKHIYGQPPIPAQPRQLFVFTDGEVGNTKEVTRLVKQHSASHRCFSFGIGEGASTALINGLAKEGGGHAQFITGGAQRMRAKVCRCAYLTIHRLGARSAIRSLEMEEDASALRPREEERKGRGASARDKAVELSVQSGVSSSYTAFVAVRQGDGAALGGPLLRRNIPAPCSMPMQMMCMMRSPQPMREYISTTLATAAHSMSFQIVTPHLLGGGSFPRRQRYVLGAALGSRPDDDGRLLFPGNGYFNSLHDMHKKDLQDEADDLCEFSNEVAPPPPPARRREPLLELVSLQKASGCWPLEEALAAALGKSGEEVEAPKPAAASEEVWATILALVWLHGLQSEARDEWQLLALKAAAWLRAQKAPGALECVEAANALLGCHVPSDTLGI